MIRYVIDGIPMVAGSIADINPNDVESMEILKMLQLPPSMVHVEREWCCLITTKR